MRGYGDGRYSALDHRPYRCERMRKLMPKETVGCACREAIRLPERSEPRRGRKGPRGAGMRRSAANAPVQRWAVPAPTPNAPLRKEVERETDAPEGNLVIVERCARERQRLFSCREYGWDGSAHVRNSTRYGNPASHVQRFPNWAHGWDGTAHVRTSTPYDRLVTHTRHYLRFDKHYIRQCLIK